MGRILTEEVFAVAYTVGDVPQPPVLVEAGSASDADSTVVLACQATHPGQTVRITALADVPPARWAGVPEGLSPVPEAAPAVLQDEVEPGPEA